MSGLPQPLRDELLAAKDAFADDQNDITRARRDVARRAVSDWRNGPENISVQVNRPNVFRGDDATAFLPESEGGNDARALELVTRMLAAQGSDADPVAELARTRGSK